MGWGHSSIGDTIEFATKAGVDQVVLFHHDPYHTDDDLEELLKEARAKSGGGERLLPPPDARVTLDRDYIFACCGALFSHFDGAAVLALMRASAGV